MRRPSPARPLAALVALVLAACSASEEPTPPPAASGTTTGTGAAAPAAAPVKPAVDAMREFIASQSIDKTASNWKTRLPKPPKVEFDPARTYLWLLETSEGPIRIRLMPGHAPMHVSSTIYLTELGFYDDLIFHRVIPGFMAQGGDPLANGTGSPGYRYDSELSPTVSHSKPGLLSMANAGPRTDGSQFFLTFVPLQQLDPKHTVFGEVVDGMQTLKALETHGTPDGPTTKKLVIESAKILVE